MDEEGEEGEEEEEEQWRMKRGSIWQRLSGGLALTCQRLIFVAIRGRGLTGGRGDEGGDGGDEGGDEGGDCGVVLCGLDRRMPTRGRRP